jgi:PPM family protein phosphatase
MIWRSREPRYDVASGVSQGARDYQEDAITSDFPVGAEAGFVVLADGMGGHSAGDVASKIVLTEVFSELKFHFADVEAFEAKAPEILQNVAELANETLRQFTKVHPEMAGMGATLVAPCLVENRLWWISVGDSSLYLYRGGKLVRLNEDHSMGPHIENLVKAGKLNAGEMANHLDRSSLLSVLMGVPIPKIDCPAKPYVLKAGDLLLCASDGLQTLSNAQIERVLTKYRKTRSTEIAERLLDELARRGDSDQDNISFTVIKINDASVLPKQQRSDHENKAVNRPKRMTSFAPHPFFAPPKPATAETPDELAVEEPEAEAEVTDPVPESDDAITENAEETVVVADDPDKTAPLRLRPRRVVVIK